MSERAMYGRQVIYSDEDEITADNVLKVLERAMAVHANNRADIQYLYDYYKGKQPILNRTKEYRPEICNRIVENRANEIVSFKVGYLMGEPVQYVSRGNGDDSISDAINALNEFVFAEDKASKDKELADWFTICGTAYRMILPDKTGEEDEAPFEIYTLDPRNAFMVYHSGLGNKPLMGVKYVTREDGGVVYSIYTANRYFEVVQSGTLNNDGVYSPRAITKNEGLVLGGIPIIEYPANSARLGAFEIVLPLLDAINNVSSNRMDGVEQFIQSLLILKGVDIDSEEYKALRENGGLKVPADGDASYLTQELNQTQTQTLVDYMYQTVLTICGMPNRNGGSSTSDTGSAVIMRDGWSAAEARAKDTELMFKMSEKKFLRLAIQIANTLRNMELKLSSIEIRFTRRNYENIQEKAQVLTTMLANDKIHPRLAFEHCGMFVDPELAYTVSKEYAEERKAEAQKELEAFAQAETAKAKADAEESKDDSKEEIAEGA
ncbi:MAG: phage portal protein [Oscillospiraceae bacterium]|nr:phage portal protein [Oscillospiraceae bacterium]